MITFKIQLESITDYIVFLLDVAGNKNNAIEIVTHKEIKPDSEDILTESNGEYDDQNNNDYCQMLRENILGMLFSYE